MSMGINKNTENISNKDTTKVEIKKSTLFFLYSFGIIFQIRDVVLKKKYIFKF